MKKLILIAFLLIPIPAHATITKISTCHAVAGSSDTNNVTTSAVSCTGANLLVAVASTYEGVTQCTVGDSSSNTWTGLTAKTVSGRNRVRIWYVYAPTVTGTQTFNCNTTGGYPAIAVIGFSGAASSPFDQENGASAGGATATLATGSITPGFDNEVIVSGAGEDSTDTYVSASGLTIEDSIAGDGSTHEGVGLAWVVQTSATAINSTWTLSTGPSGWNAAISSFKAAAAITTAGSLLSRRRR